ncbi:MAG: M23 family metallopeptidase, partial [Acidimicrobiales bacterium]|nr:M23 family metallopeptidase [Acidimicrobiales bacterium]
MHAPNRRGRTAALALAAGLLTSWFAAPALGQDATPSTTEPVAEGGAPLKEEYDEILGAEAELLGELVEAQTARRDAADALAELARQTRDTQMELLASTEALTEAEDAVEQAIADREAAAEAAEAARDRLRDQIVASYVTGGQDEGLLEALLQADSGEAIGQALAYGRAVSGTTEALVAELEDAEAAEAAAAKAAREARQEAESTRDDVAAAAELLVVARDQQQTLVDDLNVQVLLEAEALAQIQGRKAVIEGRINAMSRSSDSLAMILADLQADQPDWVPGSVPAVNPIPGVMPGSKYGMRKHPILGTTRLHAGVDMGAPSGTEIHAAADGVVVVAEVRGGYGNAVAIDHGNSLATFYAHTSVMLVKPGDLVA